ncbi:MAG: PIN domain-containing protein [Pseudomonadota bacterium]|nr:PIN domain-containing protein [Pseudomonadota bacterium]
MTRYCLDTNILSYAIQPRPSQSLLQWLGERRDEDLFVATLTIAEIWRGILQKPDGQKRRELAAWFSGPEGPPKLFEGRILAFDEDAAMIWARLMAEGKAQGRPRSPLDMIIAAVAAANDCVVATANSRDFEGLPFLDPT